MQNINLSLGDASDVVLHAINTLNRIGLLATTPAVFDEAVEGAVKAFQQERGLIVTGTINSSTFQALDEARWKLGDRVLSLLTHKTFFVVMMLRRCNLGWLKWVSIVGE